GQAHDRCLSEGTMRLTGAPQGYCGWRRWLAMLRRSVAAPQRFCEASLTSTLACHDGNPFFRFTGRGTERILDSKRLPFMAARLSRRFAHQPRQEWSIPRKHQQPFAPGGKRILEAVEDLLVQLAHHLQHAPAHAIRQRVAEPQHQYLVIAPCSLLT